MQELTLVIFTIQVGTYQQKLSQIAILIALSKLRKSNEKQDAF